MLKIKNSGLDQYDAKNLWIAAIWNSWRWRG